MFKTNFKAQIDNLVELLGDRAPKIIFRAETIALKRAVRAARTEVTKTARKRLKIQGTPGGKLISAKQFKKEFTREIVKLPKKGNGSAFLIVKGKPVTLSRFLSKPKSPPNQKGVKVSRRRKVNIEVFKGNRTTLNKGFVFYDSRGVLRIGQRRGKAIRKVRTDGQVTDVHVRNLTGASVATFFRTLRVQDKLQKKMETVFEVNFRNRFQFLARKEIQRSLKAGLVRRFS